MSLLLLSYDGEPTDLLELSLVEDVFAVAVGVAGIAPDRLGLASIRTAVAESTSMEEALAIHRAARPIRRRYPTYRVVARKSGRHAYGRADLRQVVEEAVEATRPNWKVVEDDADLEIWVHLVENRLIVAIRISDDEMSQRRYRAVSLPSSLRPTVARAMVELSRPRDDDVFLDPMCGAGTILIERALAGRYELLAGGDLGQGALSAVVANVGPRYQPIGICQWDVAKLPIADGSVTVVVTNPPLGSSPGAREQNRPIHPAIVEEAARVLVPDGRLVLLAGAGSLLERALTRSQEFKVTRRLIVDVRGTRATIYAAVRR